MFYDNTNIWLINNIKQYKILYQLCLGVMYSLWEFRFQVVLHFFVGRKNQLFQILPNVSPNLRELRLPDITCFHKTYIANGTFSSVSHKTEDVEKNRRQCLYLAIFHSSQVLNSSRDTNSNVQLLGMPTKDNKCYLVMKCNFRPLEKVDLRTTIQQRWLMVQ